MSVSILARRRRTSLLACASCLALAICMPLGERSSVAAQDEYPPPISDARTLLNNLGVEDSAIDLLSDELPLAGDQVDLLARVIAALRKATPVELETYLEPAPADPAAWKSRRATLISLGGRAIRVSAVPALSKELAKGLKLPELFRCEIAYGNSGEVAIVYSPGVPKAWPLDRPLDEPVDVRGFFARMAASDSNPVVWRPVLAAPRVAWHPPSRLSELGMDFGLFDLTRPRTRLSADDADCLYSLLGAVGRSKPLELADAAADKTYGLLPLLTDPRQHAGKLVAFTGTASRALLVRTDRELQERFGIESYFQVEMDAELEQPVLYNDKPYRRFPIVALVRELPANMPVGEDIHANVRVAGYFYSTWDYRSGAAADGAKADQFAPLIVARDLVWIEPKNERDSTAALIAAGVFAFAIALGWFSYWKASRGDRQFRKALYDREQTAGGNEQARRKV